MALLDFSSSPPAAARASGGDESRTIRAAIFGLFIAAALLGAVRKDVTRGFDEVAHVSYVAQIQQTGAFWPRLDALRLLDPATFQFTETPSYLNHPPIFYWLLAQASPAAVGNPGALLPLRLVNIALASLGLAVLFALGAAMKLPKTETYAWCIPLFAIPALAPIAGAVNNDNLAFAGGSAAMLAAHRLLAAGGARWLIAALAAMLAAAVAKLTALLLVGLMLAGVFLVLMRRGRFRLWWFIPIAVAGVAAAAPYFAFWLQYGSPAPDTPGQIALLQSTAPDPGWQSAPRLSFAAFALNFAGRFLAQWMPVLNDRSGLQYAMLAIPAAAMLCGFAGLWVSARRLWRGEETPPDVLIVTGFAAIALALAAHLGFSYRHHVAYAAIADAYPRYYLPLAGVVPLACLSLLAAVRDPRWRGAVTGFLIMGPIAFALLGAPLDI